MKFLVLILGLWAVQVQASSVSGCEGQAVSCVDHCAGDAYVTFTNANSCGTYMDSELHCERPYGECRETNSVPCEGKVVSCFDNCTQQTLTFPYADTCATVEPMDLVCTQSYGYCSGN